MNSSTGTIKNWLHFVGTRSGIGKAGALLVTSAAMGAGLSGPAQASVFSLASGGSCPTFHCTPEGTGLMSHELPKSTTYTATANNLLLSSTSNPLIVQPNGTAYTVPGTPNGTNNIPGFQSCSSDGTRAACLFQAPYAGVYPNNSISALSFTPSATSATGLPVTENFVLTNPAIVGTGTWNTGLLNVNGNAGAVPIIGTDSIVVADGNGVKRLNFDGSQVWPTSSSDPRGSLLNNPSLPPAMGTMIPSRKVMGYSLLQYGSDTAIAVTYSEDAQKNDNNIAGFVVVFNLTDGSLIGQHDLNIAVNCSTQCTTLNFQPYNPPVSHGSSLYVTGYTGGNSGTAILLKFDLATGGGGLGLTTQSGTWTGGSGVGPSGASPLYYDPSRYAGSGNATPNGLPNLIIHLPGSTNPSTSSGQSCALPSGATDNNHDHLAYFDASSLTCLVWAPLSNPIQVGPAVDPLNGGVWLWTGAIANLTGTSLLHYNAQGTTIGSPISLSDICSRANNVCSPSANPAFIGHMFTDVAPSNPNSVYVLCEVGGAWGAGETKSVVAINTSDNSHGPGSLSWAATLTDTTLVSFGGAIPLITLPNNGSPMAGVVFPGGTLPPTASGASGNVSLIYGQ